MLVCDEPGRNNVRRIGNGKKNLGGWTFHSARGLREKKEEEAQFQSKQHLSFCGFVTSFKVQVQSWSKIVVVRYLGLTFQKIREKDALLV